VRRVVELLAEYDDRGELLNHYPDLEPEDLRQVLQFAASSRDGSIDFHILARAAAEDRICVTLDKGSMPQIQNKSTPPFGLAPQTRHAFILAFWAVLICCVVVGSLLPAASPVMAAVGRLRINDKVMHFCAYLALSLLPVVGFKDRRAGLKAGLSMFLLGVLMEAGQHFSPGRAVELGDVLANGAGVSCGALLGLPIRACIAVL
jgi:VanZ family protein